MEEVFTKLQKDHKNDAETLISWMKESKIVGNNKAEEDKVKALFGGNLKEVGLSTFKEVVGKIATEKKLTLEAVKSQLAEKGKDILKNVLASATGAVKGAFADAAKGNVKSVKDTPTSSGADALANHSGTAPESSRADASDNRSGTAPESSHADASDNHSGTAPESSHADASDENLGTAPESSHADASDENLGSASGSHNSNDSDRQR